MTFEEYKDSKMDRTRLKLQQKAIIMANNGNATMMIFCLKNLCKWSDKIEDKIAIDGDNSKGLIINFTTPDKKDG